MTTGKRTNLAMPNESAPTKGESDTEILYSDDDDDDDDVIDLTIEEAEDISAYISITIANIQDDEENDADDEDESVSQV